MNKIEDDAKNNDSVFFFKKKVNIAKLIPHLFFKIYVKEKSRWYGMNAIFETSLPLSSSK